MELLLFLAGVLMGVSIVTMLYRAYYVGNLRIDNSDPKDGPYIFLELEKGIVELSSRKHVILKVKLKNFITHK